MNVLSQFLENAARWGDRTAIVAPSGEAISFSALAARSDRLAGRWRSYGIAPGDRVLVALPLGVSLYVAIAALWRLGATIVFPEPALGVGGLRQAAAATRPKAFLAAGWYRALALLPEIGRIAVRLSMDAGGGRAADIVHDSGVDHPALISFTSGSTGAPKGIVRSHGFLAAQNACLADLLRPKFDNQTDLVVFPVFVIANLGLGVASALPNWKLTRHDQANAIAIARLVAERGVSRVLAPPVICEIIAGGPPAPTLRTALTGGGPVFPDVLERLAKRLATDDIVAVYGSTEAEPVAVQPLKDISAADWKAMSEGGGLLAGRPIPQARVEIVEDEIQVAGDHVNKGYLDPARDAETKVRRDGTIWHRTDDAGRLDSSGRLWLLGRLGAKAGPWRAFMVEAAARRWAGVRQAALVPDSNPPTLALAGDARHLRQWTQQAALFSGLQLLPVDSIPVDRRHRSKVDYRALARAGLRAPSIAKVENSN